MDVFSLVATLELKADSFFSGLSDAAEALVQFGAESLETSMTFDKSMSHVQAISGSVSGSVEQQTEYMKKLTETAKTMGLQFETAADNTETAMNIINAKAAALGHDTIYTAAEVGDAFGYMAMAGWDYQEMLEGIDAVIKLAAASGNDLSRTSDIVTDAITAFGYSASDATHFADVLATVSAKANTNVDLMGETFKYVANEAGSYGWSLDEIAESIGLIANRGVKASMAGTALANVMRRITTNTSNARDLIENNLGVSVYDQDYTNPEWQKYIEMRTAPGGIYDKDDLYDQYVRAYQTGTLREWGDIVNDLRDAWEGLTDVQKAEYSKDIAGAYGSKAFKALMNATDEEAEQLRETILNSAGAADTMYATMTDNLWGDVEKYKSAFDAVKRAIGEELTPMARDFTQYGTESLDTLLLAYGEGGLDALPEALGEVIRKGAAKIEEYLPEWKENGTKIMDTISAGIQEASPILGEVIGTFGEMIGDFLSENADTITLTVATFVKSITPGIIAAVKGIASGIKEAWPEIWGGIKDLAGDLIDDVIDVVSKSNPMLGGVLKTLVGAFDEAAQAKAYYQKVMEAGNPITVETLLKGSEEAKSGLQTLLDYLNPLNWGKITIESDFKDNSTEQINTAYDAVEKLLGISNAEVLTSSYHDDETSEAALAAYHAVVTLLAENGLDIFTSSEHYDGTSEEAENALNAFLSLFSCDKEGVLTYSEHVDNASAIIQRVLDMLAKIMAEDGYTSHTQSIHDQITNVITHYYDEGTKTDTVYNTKQGTVKQQNVLNARSMFGGTILRGATLFGWDAQGVPQIGGGEGPEAVVGVNSLDQMIASSVQKGLSGIVGAIASAVQGDDRKYVIVLDTGALVGGLAPEMDAELARMGNWTAGGAA